MPPSRFDAAFAHRSGARETAELDIRITRGTEVTIVRTQKNGQCRYLGWFGGEGLRTVQGTYRCDRAKGSFQWRATIKD